MFASSCSQPAKVYLLSPSYAVRPREMLARYCCHSIGRPKWKILPAFTSHCACSAALAPAFSPRARLRSWEGFLERLAGGAVNERLVCQRGADLIRGGDDGVAIGERHKIPAHAGG
jgi:hypothetical protein